MRTVEHRELAELSSLFGKESFHLLVSASYEDRAFGIWETLRPVCVGRRFVCFNENHLDYLATSVERFRASDPKLTPVRLNSDNPIQTFRALQEIIENLRHDGPCRVIVDVTGFTRESLAILLYLARQRLVAGSVVIGVYHKASNYGRSATGGWLSQGVREIRSILGYAGLVRVAAETHLILLPGFEFERAHEIIDAIQPKKISLGNVRSEDSISEQFHKALRDFVERSEAYYSGTTLDRIGFSSVDPYFTRDALIKRARSSERNVVVACLNTKPAMIGACLAAIDEPTIQLIYAQPISYNVGAYSAPSGNVIKFEVVIEQ